MPLDSEKRWVELSVFAERDAVDDIVNLLNRYCRGGAVVDEAAPELGEPRPERVTIKGFLPVWDEETRRKLEIALLLLSTNGAISEPAFRTLEPEDWSESWKAFFPPQHIGDHTVIVPTWVEYEPQPGEMIILLDPGMAFGTGQHATTRLCLQAIEEIVQPGMEVLDVGTGSGILSIAAALHGASDLDAIDNDPVAVEATHENLALNKVDDRVRATHGTLGDHVPGHIPVHPPREYDLLLVNILAGIIIDMASALPRAMKQGAQAVFSGIIVEREAEVVAALTEAGLVLDRRLQEDHWVALIAHKP